MKLKVNESFITVLKTIKKFTSSEDVTLDFNSKSIYGRTFQGIEYIANDVEFELITDVPESSMFAILDIARFLDMISVGTILEFNEIDITISNGRLKSNCPIGAPDRKFVTQMNERDAKTKHIAKFEITKDELRLFKKTYTSFYRISDHSKAIFTSDDNKVNIVCYDGKYYDDEVDKVLGSLDVTAAVNEPFKVYMGCDFLNKYLDSTDGTYDLYHNESDYEIRSVVDGVVVNYLVKEIK